MAQHSKLTVDFAGLGIPPGNYALPAPGSYEDYDRLLKHFKGELALADLAPDDVRFLRSHFSEQVAEHQQVAMDYFTARVPRRFATAYPEEQASEWALGFAADRHAVKSLLLIGPTGVGKTHYAWSVLRAVAESGTQLRWQMHTAVDLYASLRPRDGEDSQSTFERIADAHLLVLDDLGASKWTEWVEEITYRLINHRYEECLPSIFTSNLAPAKLRDALGERVASRLTEMCDRIVLKGDDRRKGGAK
ncbi:ATP-binding protein [Streptomyces griseofuscus]|uniref:IstB-like ATP binding protein n=1 Tax=Streptomyces griseofuscus TaxID=146922 RepID=A0A7H1Q909_9ACTN|nr:ATP-binding protein [Streptomyces griseofuscus]QNT96789.1 IstB-like ATP binding protein [Streptomyces griseofuscus]